MSAINWDIDTDLIAYRFTLIASLFWIVIPASWAAPIATNTALPISANEIIVRVQLVSAHASDSPGGLNRHVDRIEARSVLGYGLTSKLAIFGMLPVVYIDQVFGDVRSSDSGLGDAALFARYEVFRSDKPGRTFRIAP